MVCSRAKEITGYDTDFNMTMTDLYKRVEEGFEFGVKRDVLISDLKVTLTGVEVSFAPMKGKEGEFYVAYSTIPVLRTSYIPDKNQFVLEFKDTEISSNIVTGKIKEQNGYVYSVELKEDGANSVVTINLKNTAKFYNAKVDHEEPLTDGSPYVRFTFRNTIF